MDEEQMDTRILVFALAVSILTFLYFYLAYAVIMYRRRQKVAFLTNEDKYFISTFRAHANFSEYVPLALILMAVAVYLEMHLVIYTFLTTLFVLSRFLHAYAFLSKKSFKHHFRWRFWSVAITLTTMGVFASYNLFKSFNYLMTN
jgi:uncharacterized membrane protein YecN with MAPEG domain